MHITREFLSIPPYISTSWKEIEVLLSDGKNTLNVYLKNGLYVKIAPLLQEELDIIFKVHQEVLLQKPEMLSLSLGGPLCGPFLEHDPALCDASPLPENIKKKLKSLLEGLPTLELPPASAVHMGCYCPHCQIMSLIYEDKIEPEPLLENDLNFATWEITALTSTKFKLTHPYQKDEVYFVCLETPIHCSCEKSGCEHLIEVLKN